MSESILNHWEISVGCGDQSQRQESEGKWLYFVICVIFYNAVIIYTNSIVTVCVFAEVAKFLDWSREFGQRTKKL